ncbi:Uncharacterised protein [Niallia circulans]|uniref:hypothetical protein n=1 Tax=Niallia circulans TaxID=1397 RepID=UPI00077CAD42|nr:hypothetical protein [Niallia circulans]MDR4315031.1 hypothetical protein [Niallia circulans]MED3839762.1 hypothetical protein [Niallia circulans]MED4241248.1 hypothetical protein [Niallia circulans]MED4247909.1 hypothetical protein [Niallia circulans]QKH61612.1 hypothetical protein FOC77_13620 [Niallia circulans]
MSKTYGQWHLDIRPSEWTPDYSLCTLEEIERWERDLEKEKQGQSDFEGFYGLGVISKNR